MPRLKKALDVKREVDHESHLLSLPLRPSSGTWTYTPAPSFYMKICHAQCDKPKVQSINKEMRAKLTTSTPMTPELFMQWKKKKIAERDAGLASQQAERAKNDRMSGRELFLSDSSLFVDDAEAYDKYQREPESDVAEQKVNDNSAANGPSGSTKACDDAGEDDDELNMDELNELEASLSKTSLQI
ncbi:zinc finger CCCH domain-containing protein 11-like isoform X2 [Fagus crenata]